MSTTFMKCARNYTLRSLTGHIIHFKADEPTKVPLSVVDEALAVNIIPCDGYAPEGEEKAPTRLRISAMTIELREALLLHAIDEIYREADPKNFDGGGRPKTTAIADRAGLDISATERSKLYDKYRDIKASNTDLPRPANFELVVDAQQMNTKLQLLEYAEVLGLDPKELKGATLKELKAAVVSAAIQFKPSAVESTLDED